MSEFHGAKAVLMARDGLVVLRRDDDSSIEWPDLVDLPGGARDGAEQPLETVRREIAEELGLDVPESRFFLSRRYSRSGRSSWLFVARITEDEVARIHLGDEGQGWWIEPLEVFLDRSDAIPHFQSRVRGLLGLLTGFGW